MYPPASLKNEQSFLQNKPLILSVLLLSIIAIGFWTGSRYPALNEKAIMGADTNLSAIGFSTLYDVSPDLPAYMQIIYNTINWIYTNRQGMSFGIVFAAMLMTVLPLIKVRDNNNRFINSAVGMAIGVPLGVCVNCAAPIAKGLHTAGAKVETTLATMVSSPTLNVIVLAIAFSLFPPYMVAVKIVLTVIFALLVVPLLTRFLGMKENIVLDDRQAKRLNRHSLAPMLANTNLDRDQINDWGTAALWVVRSFAQNLWFIIKTTVPLMLLAGFLGSAFITIVPFEKMTHIIPADTSLRIVLLYSAILALIGLFLPVPMSFDVIVVAIMMQIGLPVKYAMVLLFTLGIFSIYSFFIVWTSVSKAGAVGMFGTLLILGLVGGWSGEKLREWDVTRQESFFIESLAQGLGGASPEIESVNRAEQGMPADALLVSIKGNAVKPVPFMTTDGVSVEAVPFTPQKIQEKMDMPFGRFQGAEFGFAEDDNFSVRKFLIPYSVFRGIAAGDVHNDGWTDIVVTSERGLALYANNQGQNLIQQQINIPEISDFDVMNAALVDLDNDGWLDLYFSVYRQGNYVIYNQEGQFISENMVSLPNQEAAFLTAAPAFGDVDRDGDLDILIGNWSGGPYNRGTLPSSRDVLLINENREFKMTDLPGPPGQALTSLFTDFNNDGYLDLLVGNDFEPSDVYYVGDGRGGFQSILKDDGVIPYTTYSTMSFATADINNDLIPELFAGQVSRGGRAEALPPEEACSEITDAQENQTCMQNMIIRDHIQDAKEERDVRICMTLADSGYRGACIATSLVAFATYLNRNQAYCDLLPANWSTWSFVCNQSFEAPYELTETQEAQAIPQIQRFNILFTMQGDGHFVDVAKEMGLQIGGWTWNAKFADLDNDEWQDMYVANGYMIGDVALTRQESNYFFHNQEGQKFVEASQEFGLSSYLDNSSYTYVDIDNDGDLDIILVPIVGPISTFINNTDNGNAMEFELRDQIGNHFGIGSKIIIHYGTNGTQHQIREFQAGGGYISFDAPLVHFGLGEFDKVTQVEVIWSTGERTVLDGDFAAGMTYIISRE